MLKLGWAMSLAAFGGLALGQARMQPQRGAPPLEVARGNPARGQTIVAGKGGCLSCHRISDQGSHLGPDLSAIGIGHTVAQLQKALLDPNPEVSIQFRMFKLITKAGKSYTGRLMNQDRTSIQLLDTNDRLRGFLKDDLATYNFVPTPAMPSYREKLTAGEQDDVIAYLLSLKGIVKQ